MGLSGMIIESARPIAKTGGMEQGKKTVISVLREALH